MTDFFWKVHKPHHQFYNPTPFAVIADEYLDQMIRALPLVLFPLIAPWNMDLMYVQFAVFFYGYGVAIHSGHEFESLSAHNYWINTPFQHYIHHAKGRFKHPYHTGFFFKIWDRAFGSLYDKECVCVRCETEKGLRSYEKWQQVKIQDYSELFNWRFWIYGPNKVEESASEMIGGDKKTE